MTHSTILGKIAPSLLCLDPLKVKDQVETLEVCGISKLHVDILDGHFSPSMPLGFDLVKAVRKITNLRFECHVMVQGNVEYYIDELLKVGVSSIVFQVEGAGEEHVDRLLSKIQSEGAEAGVALKPSTSLTVLDWILPRCNRVLLMQINPGYASFAGEETVPYIDDKIRQFLNFYKNGRKLELDGRVSINTVKKWYEYVESFVGGSSLFGKDFSEKHIKEVICSLERVCQP